MGRFLLYLLIVGGAVASVPALRHRVAGPVSAVYARVEPRVKQLIDPAKEIVSEREQNAIIGQLRDLHDSGRDLPTPRAFEVWVRDHVFVGNDPWGNPYFLLRQRGGASFVGSNGRDGVRGTPDDIMVKVPW
jgi:hypothetical protein